MQKVNSRLLVLEMLLSVTKDGQGVHSHIAVREVLNKYNYLSQQEKSFIKRLFEGTLERMIELDYCINCFSKVPTKKIKPVILMILRMSVYQFLYMDSVPDAAACNEAVKLAQMKGFTSLKGFVNGVLRTIARNKDAIEYPNASVAYSMPEWIVELWTNQLGTEKTEQLLRSLLIERPVSIRFRRKETIENDIAALKAMLDEHGGKITSIPYLPYAYQISRTDDITKLAGYESGAFVVQDVSSMLAVEALQAGNFFQRFCTENAMPLVAVDICAAPGGKSMLLADLLESEGITDYTIRAGDSAGSKVLLMKENCRRCGLEKIAVTTWDAVKPCADLEGKADIVIADVPCSGLGVIGKKRDIKYKISPDAIEELVELQRRILRTAAGYLKQGGRLLFCTCTINQKENEENTAWIIKELKLMPDSFADALPQQVRADITEQRYLQLFPDRQMADGFFISIFTKTVA